MMRVSKVDIGPLRALRFWEHQPTGIRFARAGAICQIPAESATRLAFLPHSALSGRKKRPYVLHVGRVMKSISHFCASTRGRKTYDTNIILSVLIISSILTPDDVSYALCLYVFQNLHCLETLLIHTDQT